MKCNDKMLVSIGAIYFVYSVLVINFRLNAYSVINKHFSSLVQTLWVTVVGVEVRKQKTGDLRWCLDFRDMDSPSVILLADAYGRNSAEGGGFVLCPLYGRKCKAFIAASGVSNSAILSKMVCQ